MWTIQIAKSADKVLKKAPLEIRNAFDAWKNVIQLQGVSGLKAINGYRDPPLKGDWEGAMSVHDQSRPTDSYSYPASHVAESDSHLT